jgi:hypothetical protein
MTFVSVSNPYAEATEVYLLASQTNPLYRTYIGNRWLTLEPGEVKSVPVMVEYKFDHLTYPDTLLHITPNRVDIVALIVEPDGDAASVLGGVQLEVVNGRTTRFDSFGPVSETVPDVVAGQLVTVDDGSAVSNGKVLIEVTSAKGTEYVEAALTSGHFSAIVGTDWITVQAHYIPEQGYGRSSSKVRALPELTIPGGNGDDLIVVQQDPANEDNLRVAVTGSVQQTFSLPIDDLEALTLMGLAGADTVTLDLGGVTLPDTLLNLDGGEGDDHIDIQGALANFFGRLSIDGGGGNDTLTFEEPDGVVPDPASKFDAGAWLLLGVNEGMYGTSSPVPPPEEAPGHPVPFTGIENLVGSPTEDTFLFEDGAFLAGTIDGGPGSDTADYSRWTSAAPADWQKHPHVEVLLDHNNHHSLPVLRRQHGFHFAGSLHQNAFGANEKWFRDRDLRWYFILPNGQIRLWRQGAALSTSPLIATVASAVHGDPALLFNAELALTEEERRQLSSLQKEHGFRFAGSFYQNAFGANEKWFKDRDQQWFVITPDGQLRQWDGGANLSTSPTSATVPPLVYDDPTLLFNAEVMLTEDEQEQLSSLRKAHGFAFAGSFYQNAFGANEKWFRDRHQEWFVITPDGQLRQWDGGANLSTSPTIAAVSPLVYDDPALLFNAEVKLDEEERAQLANLQSSFGFRAAASDYRDYFGFNEKWFLDRDNLWYIITPDGTIRLWTGDANILDDNVIAVVTPLAYDLLALLFGAV